MNVKEEEILTFDECEGSMAVEGRMVTMGGGRRKGRQWWWWHKGGEEESEEEKDKEEAQQSNIDDIWGKEEGTTINIDDNVDNDDIDDNDDDNANNDNSDGDADEGDIQHKLYQSEGEWSWQQLWL